MRSCSDASPSRTRGSLIFKLGAAYSPKPTTSDRAGHSRTNTIAGISLSTTSGGQAQHFTYPPTTSYPQQIFTVRNEVFQYVQNTFGQPLFGQPSFSQLTYYQPFSGQPSFGHPPFSQPPIEFQFSQTTLPIGSIPTYIPLQSSFIPTTLTTPALRVIISINPPPKRSPFHQSLGPKELPTCYG